ncbi:tRNA glutamyl-Q(34) synthetase GluQRS [Sulfitobacter guttiformis]|uniref:Glutamyl-Q tRNA(Asp) synthetase n=1 Tax=Sulfitobacter guttiformis TaxID=74349 RepID=A0A420DIA4_9RHOB|nr:tRNA glutamyl-Q(34) synthetase GluQRS [Sulfitobacter guttiformis]KIN72290.1 Glutamyl-Q-tRNA synthetase [Sulfitobacter guttiformis KCTC 32187]RKE93944.1 glutamyl-Q tRNA(Asp) synthetase [Sulfitobacter guttiformis]
MTLATRFAPSPTGPLHLGHAYSALLAYGLAQAANGRFLLRIEDIDLSRARPEWEAQIYSDLAWLGIEWELPVMRQSKRQPAYDAALDKLWQRGVLYPCYCSRADIAAATAAPQEGAPMLGPDGLIYPGTCRTDHPPTTVRPRDLPLRLNMAWACAQLDWPLGFTEEGSGTAQYVPITADEMQRGVGDIVLARRDMGTSYHLSVVLDDAAQHITHVVRGRDLLEATAIHVVVQALLDLPTPVYHHHRLIRDETGKRLAKRDNARAIALMRSEGHSVKDIQSIIGL